jgi:hypothetical protein
VEAARQILAQAADAEVAGEEAEAGDQLVDVQEQLALAHRVEEHRHGADFHRVRAEPDQVTGQPLQLRDEDADVVNPLRHRETEQLLDGQHVRQAVRLCAEVVHPLDEGHHLLPLLLLGRLLDAGVQVADRRHHRLDEFAIELQHQTEHAVRAGVLRPHVDGHRFGANLGHMRRAGPFGPA